MLSIHNFMTKSVDRVSCDSDNLLLTSIVPKKISSGFHVHAIECFLVIISGCTERLMYHLYNCPVIFHDHILYDHNQAMI